MSRFRHWLRTTAAVTLAGVSAASAQTPAGPAPVQPVDAPLPSVSTLFQPGMGQYSVPGPCPPAPCGPTTGSPTVPPGVSGLNLPPTMSDPAAGLGAGGGPNLSTLLAGADAGPTAGLGGYIDNAVPVTQFRLRYDAAYGSNRPDRAEFFYAKCGCFRTPAGGNQLDANGPPLPETNVDYQTLSPYLEIAVSPRLSFFANVPVRFINPQQNVNASGIGDLSFGGKYAFVYSPTRVLSAQLTVTVPTGDQFLGLGTGVTWLEPGLLYQEQLSDRWQLFGQFKDIIPLTRQSDFTGNILNYGVGTSYMVARGCWGYVAPVGEVVGWTVLSGKELDPNVGAVSAVGDTIVNAKVGVRIGFGSVRPGSAYPTRSDLYIGYGRALTGEVWYKNMFRVEYRLNF
jgi:hypothetical protein